MILRAYEPRDREAVMALYRDDQLAVDPAHPANPVAIVAELDGRVVAAIVGRVKFEAHLALDHSVGQPEDRLAWINALAEYGIEEFESIGAPAIEFAVMPHQRSWAKRIEAFPFAVRDERIHFRVIRKGDDDGRQFHGTGAGCAAEACGTGRDASGSTAASERAGWRPYRDSEQGLAADPSEHAGGQGADGWSSADPEQALHQ